MIDLSRKILSNSDSIRNRLIESRHRTLLLCDPLEIEDYIPQPVSFTSPPKWHLAHTTWFFEEMILTKHLEEYRPFHADFSFLFNSYYQSVGERADRLNRGSITRPTVKQVYAYRKHVDEALDLLFQQDLSIEIQMLLELGIQHEQQHQELLITDLKHTFSLNPLHPVYDSEHELVADVNQESGWVDMTEGIYDIGYEGSDFCFDNELNRHQVYLNDYSIRKSLVTNGEFIDFIEEGAYQNFAYWLDEGWTWIQKESIALPLYWIKKDDKYFQYTLAGLKPIEPDQILIHISFYEAHAFSQWKEMRLCTEFEWEAACNNFSWGKRWEWTYSAYLPYPGFKIDKGPIGEYNGKFMINQMVLRGGSIATAPGHSRYSYRNFFHPDLRWQCTGIRLAK